jgi:hypothetical protein
MRRFCSNVIVALAGSDLLRFSAALQRSASFELQQGQTFQIRPDNNFSARR